MKYPEDTCKQWKDTYTFTCYLKLVFLKVSLKYWSSTSCRASKALSWFLCKETLMVLLVNVKFLVCTRTSCYLMIETSTCYLSLFRRQKLWFCFLQFWGSDDNECFWERTLTKKGLWVWVHTFVLVVSDFLIFKLPKDFYIVLCIVLM